MRRSLPLALCLSLIAASVQAGTLDETKVALTLKAHATKAQCTTNAPSEFGCDAPTNSSNLVVDGEVAVGYDMYVVCLDVDTSVGLAGAAFGIQYPSEVAVFGWTHCADLEFPGQGWPASGGGNSITFNTWEGCPGQVADPSDPQGQSAVVMGWFYCYAYAPASFESTRRNLSAPDLSVADCSANVSNLAFPGAAGKVGFGQAGYQPCREPQPPDLTHPVLLEATGGGGENRVVVEFSEPVSFASVTAQDFHLTPGLQPGQPFPILGVGGSGAVVLLDLGGLLAYDTTYILAVGGITDLAGNPIAANSSVTFATGPAPPQDDIPPFVLQALGTGGEAQILVEFSEPVALGATTTSNYQVTPGPGGTGSYTISGAALDGSRVTLSLTALLAYSRTYTVTVHDVADTAGNVIVATSSASFTTGPAPGDVTPPLLIGATGVAGGTQVFLEFSEGVLAGASTTANYRVTPGPAGGDAYDVLLATCQGVLATLALRGQLEPGTTYTVTVSNVADLAGNLIAPNSTASFTTAPEVDTTPPTLVDAAGVAGTKIVDVWFSEPVGQGAGATGNYTVTYPGGKATVTGTGLDGDRVRLTLGSSLQSGRTYTLTVRGIYDLAGNLIQNNDSVSFIPAPTGDTTPPTLTAVSGTAASLVVLVQFSEPVSNGATTVANYRVAPGPGGLGTAVIVAATRNDALITLSLAAPLEYSTTYTVSVSDVADIAGNFIARNSVATFTTGAAPPPPDLTPPTLVAASGTVGSSQILVQYSESVGSGATDVASYAVTPGLGGSGVFPIQGAVLSGTRVTLSLAGALEYSTTYTVTVSNVADLAGNVIAPNSTAAFATANPPIDTSHPTLVSASGLAGKYTVVVRFSEPVGSGADVPGNYRITDEPPTGVVKSVYSVSADGDRVTLILGGLLSPPGDYRVTVSDVDDLAGNAIRPDSYVTFTAGSPQLRRPVIALHLKPHATKAQCTLNAPLGPCEYFQVEGSVGVSYDLYIVVVDLSETGKIAGATCGISYPGELAVYYWTACADEEYPAQGWPASGGGNVLTWDRVTNCQQATTLPEVDAVAGWFYVYAYAPARFSIEPRNVTPIDLKVADCNGLEYGLDPFSDAGAVTFGSWGALNPCFTLAVNIQTTTWGAIKRTYGSKP